MSGIITDEDRIEYWSELCEKLQARVKALEKGLAWYADQENYRTSIEPDVRCNAQHFCNAVIYDNGNRARLAISASDLLTQGEKG